MGGFNVGDLFGSLNLDDSQYAAALERSKTGTKVFKEAIAQLRSELVTLSTQFIKEGVELEDIGRMFGMDADAVRAYTQTISALQAKVIELNALTGKTITTESELAAKRVAFANQVAQGEARALAIREDIVKRLAANDVKMANQMAEGEARSLAIERASADERVALANQVAAGEARADAISLAAKKAEVAEKIQLANQYAEAEVRAALITKAANAETNAASNVNFRLTQSGVRGSVGGGGLIAAGAGAFATFELAKMIEQTADAARETQNLADRLNISWQAARDLEVQAKLSGVSLNGLEQSAYHLAQALEDPAGQGKRVAVILESIGVTGATSGELLQNFLKYLSGIGDSTKRIELLHEVFQRSSQQIEPLVTRLVEMQSITSQLGPNIDANLTKQLEKAALQFSLLSVQWDRWKERTATGFIGQMAGNAAKGTADWLGRGGPFEELYNLIDASKILGGTLAHGLGIGDSIGIPGLSQPKGGPSAASGSDAAFVAAQERARAFRNLHAETLDDLKAQLSETKKVVADLDAALGSTINPILDKTKYAKTEDDYNNALYNQLTLQKKIQDLEQQQKADPLGKKDKVVADDTSSLFSSVGLSDFAGRIRAAQEAMDTLMSRGLLNPTQVEMAKQGIQELKDKFAALGEEIVILAQPSNTLGTNALALQFAEIKKEGKDAWDIAIKLHGLLMSGKIGNPDDVAIPQTLDNSANNTQKAALWTEKWAMHLAQVSDELGKIKTNQIKEGITGPGGPDSEVRRIEAFAKNHGIKLFDQETLNDNAGYARKVFDDLTAYIQNGGQVARLTYLDAEKAMIDAVAAQRSMSARAYAKQLGIDYDGLSKAVQNSVTSAESAWKAAGRRLSSEIGRDLQKVIGDVSSGLVALLPIFNDTNKPIDELTKSLRSAYEQLSAYANPKAALTSLIDSIQHAGSISQANAIAVKYFGNQAGPILAAELRNGTLAAKDIAAAINTASSSTQAYADLSTKSVNAVTQLWQRAVRDILQAITKHLVESGLKVLIDWIFKVGTSSSKMADDVVAALKNIGQWIGIINSNPISLGGTAANTAGTVAKTASTAGDIADDAAGVATTGAGVASGAGNAAAGFAGQAASAWIGAISSAVTAVSSVVGNFQMSHMNTSLGRIEVSTRGSLNEALNLRKDLWDQHFGLLAKFDMIFNRLGDMWASLRDIASHTMSGGSASSSQYDYTAVLGSISYATTLILAKFDDFVVPDLQLIAGSLAPAGGGGGHTTFSGNITVVSPDPTSFVADMKRKRLIQSR